MAYPLYSASPEVGECPPGVQSISKAEYDAFIATQARAYCAKAESGWLYRASSETCASGDETLTKSDYEARARVFPMRARCDLASTSLKEQVELRPDVARMSGRLE